MGFLEGEKRTVCTNISKYYTIRIVWYIQFQHFDHRNMLNHCRKGLYKRKIKEYFPGHFNMQNETALSHTNDYILKVLYIGSKSWDVWCDDI